MRLPLVFPKLILLAAALFAAGLHSDAGGVVTTATESALNAALAGGGTVIFDCGGTITFTSTKTITTNTVLNGNGNSITLSGGNAVRLFNVETNGNLALIGITLSSGKSTNRGGAVFNLGTLTAFQTQFVDNQVIGINGTNGANGAFAASGTAQSGRAGSNGTTATGGAIYNAGTALLASCGFWYNSAQGGHGGHGGDGGDANATPGQGADGGNGRFALGGAIYSTNAITITNCYFIGNTAFGGYGGRGGNGGVSPSYTYANGQGGQGAEGAGGGLWCRGTILVMNSTFAQCLAIGGDSGDCGTSWFDRRITGGQNANIAGLKGGTGNGGAIRNLGTNTVINCTFSENQAEGGAGGDGSGGQIAWNSNAQEWQGQAGVGGDGGNGRGGGIASSNVIAMTNCTFFACKAVGGVPGAWGPPIGSIYTGADGLALGGNIARSAATFAMKNCLFAKGTNGGNGYGTEGTWIDGGQNISSDNSISLNTAISRKNVDPKILALAENGGWIPTCALMSNSPAINGATNGAPLTDQRNYFRYKTPDIGAVEYFGSPDNHAFVEVEPADAWAGEAGTNEASFVVRRFGKTTETNFVSLDLSGTAVAGVDYVSFPTNLIFLPGVTETNLTVLPLQNAPEEPAETIVVGLKPGTNYVLGLFTNALVTLEQDGPPIRNAYPVGERYLRGTGTNLTFYTIIVPFDGLKGTKRADIETNSTLSTVFHYDGALGGTQTQTNGRLACNTPIVSFGGGAGTGLRPHRSYSVGIHLGSLLQNPISIEVYYRSNSASAGSFSLLAPDEAAWNDFATNGFSVTTNAFGLSVTLRHASPPVFGTEDFGYVLTHRADAMASNYIYLVRAKSKFGSENANLSETATAVAGYCYDLRFDERPGWQSVFVEQPHFRREPLPPDLLGKSSEEILNFQMLVTNAVSLSPSTCTNLDASPELRRHPVLDQFVSDMNNDPVVLANYVQNEIELIDAIAYRDDGNLASESVNLGGVNRSATGVFLEGQGSPIEQCALLVYLLRQAGYPAAYMFPPDGGIKMLDTRLSQLLRLKIEGAEDSSGHLYTTNKLIPVNYPWVATYVGGQWVHLFPWLKDTAVIEGLNLNDYLPDQYKDTLVWTKDYVYGRSNIMSFATLTDDTPASVFPRWLDAQLKSNAPGISLEDLGMQYVNRRHLYSDWSQFPRPTWVTNSGTAIESLTDSALTTVSASLTNLFDTITVEIFSLVNPSKRISTPEMRMSDLHNRKFYLTHTNLGGGLHQAVLTLAPFSPLSTGLGSFDSSDRALTNKQVSVMMLDGSDDELKVHIRYRRQKALSWQTALDTRIGFLELTCARELLQERTLRKGDLAALCLSVGRVTPAMLRVHAQELWNMQQQIGTNAASANTVSPDIYQGSTVYLMGMSYYERVERFDDTLRNLTKVQNLASCAMGFALLSPRRSYDGTLPDGEIDLVWPHVDMFFRELVLAGNSSVRMDSGWPTELASRNYIALSVADLSAQEHAVINSFFGQSAAVSTVRLLQLTQSRVGAGGSNIVELTGLNFESEGEKMYGGIPLKEYPLWGHVKSFFKQDVLGLFTLGWVTPGNQSTPSGSFSGMAALLISPYQQGALIGNNLYGAYGTRFSDFQLSSGNLPNWELVQQGSDYRLNLDSRAANQFRNQEVFNNAVAPLYIDGFNNNSLVPTPIQTQFGALASFLVPDNSYGFPTLFALSIDLGNLGIPADNAGANWIADPVNAQSGEFHVDAVDLTLPGPMPLQIRRNYSSHNLAANQLGYGWKLNYMPFLVLGESNIICVAEADGSVLAFGTLATNLWAPTAALNPALNNNSANGVGSVANAFNARLARVFTNSSAFYYLTNGDGSLRVFVEMSFPLTNSSAWDRQRPYLTTWFDNQGNAYRFEYGTNAALADYGQVRRIVSSSGNILRFEYDVFGHIVNVYSADGRRVQYTYDDHGDLISVQRPDASVIEYDYQVLSWATNGVTNIYSTHLLVQEIKPDGRVLKNEYDELRRVTNQWATVGPDLRLVRNATFRYTNNFNLTNITATLTGTTTILDFTNNPTTFFYTNGLLRRIVDPLGGEIVQTWYEANETNAPAYPRSLKTVTDKRGLLTTYLYDTRGNVTNTTIKGDLLGDGNLNTVAVTAAEYNTNNMPLRSVDASGTTNLYFYTNGWLLARLEIWPKNAMAAQAVTNLYAYATVTNAIDGTFANGLRVQEIRAAFSPDAATNESAYSSRGFPIGQTRYTGTADPAVVITNIFNTRGELVARADAAGRRTAFSYDPNGTIESQEVFEAGQSVPAAWDFYYYNENGELTWTDGPRYNPEDYTWRDYDGGGRKSQEIRWRSQGRVDGTGVEAAAGSEQYATTFYEYDPFNNLTRVIDPLGNYARKQYNALGQLLREEFYNSNGQLLATNGFGYNLAGDVTHSFNALGGSTEKQYTSTGKLKFQRNPDGSTNGWLYYADDRLRREIQNNGAYWETSYDDAARIQSRIFYSPANVPLATNLVAFDRRGNTVQKIDAAGNPFITIYDGLNRVKVSAGPEIMTVTADCGMNPDCNTHITNLLRQAATNFYDAAGIFVTNVNALGEKTVTASDALGRTVSVQTFTKGATVPLRLTSTSYRPDHHGFTVTEGAGSEAIATTTWTDNSGKPVLLVKSPTAGVLEYTFTTYDRNGNPIQSDQRSSASGSLSLWSYSLRAYDGLNRLMMEAPRGNDPIYYNRDALGSVTNRVMPGGLNWRASYNAAGQKLKDWVIGSTGGAVRSNSYSYHPAGSAFTGLLATQTRDNYLYYSFFYDDWLRQTNASRSLWGGFGAVMLTTTEYDARGFAVRVTEENANTGAFIYPIRIVSRSFDAYGQLVSESISLNGQTYSDAWQSWDSAGRRARLNFNQLFEWQYGSRADGKLASVQTPFGNATYGYDSAGVLTNRSVGSRSTRITSRDGMGRPLAVSSLVNLASATTETLAWNNDSTLSSHIVARSDFSDSRSYVYESLSRRLSQEQLNIGASTRWTNTFAYDSTGSGALIRAGGADAASATWSGVPGSTTPFVSETNRATRLLAFGRVNGAASVNISLDGTSLPVTVSGTGDSTWPNRWQSTFEANAGAHQLSVQAVHPSSQFSTNAVSWFTNNLTKEIVSAGWDFRGNLMSKTFRAPDGSTRRSQYFTWDEKDRLTKLVENDAQGFGYALAFEYDGLDRRLTTKWEAISNNVVSISSYPIVVRSYYDPSAEFLEVGVSVDSATTWKLCGPDLDGRYGGLNGTGGFDAVAFGQGQFQPTISDARGNVLGAVSNGVVAWNAARPTGYGAVPGHKPLPLGHGGNLVQSSAWRGRWVDVSGWCYLGARHYDLSSGSFMSVDPIWNSRDPNYYSFCGGDPINYFDADGRIGTGIRNGFTKGDFYQPGNADQELGQMIGQIAAGVTPGYNFYADARDTAAAFSNLGNGGWKSGSAWLAAGVSILAWIPGLDALKGADNSIRQIDNVPTSTQLEFEFPRNDWRTETPAPPQVSFDANTTRLGITRSNPADWRDTRDLWDGVGYGDILSHQNRDAIAKGRTPTVDESWIQFFPEDAGLLGERIPMHHIGGMPLTVPLPETRHLDAHMPGGFRYNPGGPGSALPFYPEKQN